MSSLTGLLYGGLGVYLAGWYLGKWSGNFSLLLFVLTVVTFGYWLAERFVFAPRRVAAAHNLEQNDVRRRNELARQGIARIDGDVGEAKQALLAQPWWLDWTAGLFPVILVVFLLRSFLFEPFKIPSGSMIPTLLVGDLILVNKYHYGIRLPVIHTKIVPNNVPKRGDVMVFRYPKDTSIDYIKRVVGVPGDEVSYRNQQLFLNDEPVPTTALPDFFNEETLRLEKQYSEKLGDSDVSGREFTLMTSSGEIRVDTTGMSYNPLDDQGYQQLSPGDRVYVSGLLDDDLFERREIQASTLITLNENAAGQQLEMNR